MDKIKSFIGEKNKLLVLVLIIILLLSGAFLMFSNSSLNKGDDSIIINKDKQKLTREIEITNDEDKEILYDLKWTDVTNNFRTQSDLLYSITSSDGKVVVTDSQVPIADSPVMINVSLPKGTTHKYVLKVWYKKSKDSKDDGSGNFKGRIEIEKHSN